MYGSNHLMSACSASDASSAVRVLAIADRTASLLPGLLPASGPPLPPPPCCASSMPSLRPPACGDCPGDAGMPELSRSGGSPAPTLSAGPPTASATPSSAAAASAEVAPASAGVCTLCSRLRLFCHDASANPMTQFDVVVPPKRPGAAALACTTTPGCLCSCSVAAYLRGGVQTHLAPAACATVPRRRRRCRRCCCRYL